jgi:hypothetical protein
MLTRQQRLMKQHARHKKSVTHPSPRITTGSPQAPGGNVWHGVSVALWLRSPVVRDSYVQLLKMMRDFEANRQPPTESISRCNNGRDELVEVPIKGTRGYLDKAFVFQDIQASRRHAFHRIFLPNACSRLGRPYSKLILARTHPFPVRQI